MAEPVQPAGARPRLGAGVEFDLIRRVLAEAAAREPASGSAAAAGLRVIVGPGDDCAVLAGGLVIGTDLQVEDVHFRRDWITAEEIGYRAAVAALSDLAAMAAGPAGLLASLAVSGPGATEDAARVMSGISAAGAAFGAPLLGGDMSASPGPLVVDITVLGNAPAPVLRSGARAGDTLWVTGPLGGAAAAVRSWRQGAAPSSAARAAFAAPRARIAEALWLAERQVLHALIDLSDGLAGDARHLAAASDARVIIDRAAIPVHEAAREAGAAVPATDASALALTGGEDYELLFAAAEADIMALAGSYGTIFGSTLTRVGEVVAGSGVWLRAADGTLEPLAESGYRHFEAGA